MATKTLEDIAGELFDSFTKSNAREVWTTDNDDARDIADAHGLNHLPCDWHYEQVRNALGAIHDGELTDDDDVHDWADSNVDTYNTARREWLTKCGQYDADQAKELGSDDGDVDTLLGIAQYVELRSIAYAVLEGVRGLVDDE